MRNISYLLAASFAATLTTGASASVVTWKNTATNFNNAGSWNPGLPVAGDTALFTGTPAFQPNLTAGWTASLIGLDFASTGWNVTATTAGSELRVANSVDNGGHSVRIAAGAAVTIGSNVVLRQQSAGTWSMGSGSTLVADNMNFNRAATVDGPGKVVIQAAGAGNRGFNATGGATVLINATTNTAVNDSPYQISGIGTTLGGTGTIIGGSTSSTSIVNPTVGNGAVLAPGGDGTYGSEIAKLTFQLDANNSNGNQVVMSTGSTLRMQLGNSSGANDQLAITTASTYGGYLKLNSGVGLDLSGPVSPITGTYTLVTMANLGAANYGTFETIKYNGVDVTGDSSIYSLAYNTNSIVLTMIPEPASMAMVALGASLLRRRRA